MDIGKIKLKDGTEATLSDDGKWSCKDTITEQYLNFRFSPHDARGVDVLMPFGLMAIERAASKLGASVLTAPKVGPLPDGVAS